MATTLEPDVWVLRRVDGDRTPAWEAAPGRITGRSGGTVTIAYRDGRGERIVGRDSGLRVWPTESGARSALKRKPFTPRARAKWRTRATAST